MSQRLEKVIEIARAGGKLALSMRNDLSRSRKSDGSVVTNADIAVQRLINERLRDAFADCGIVGEEENLDLDHHLPRVFVVDPIDGTHSYQRGFPHYGVSIGLVENGRCVLGVFYNPALDNMYSVDTGESFRLNGAEISPRPSDDNDTPVIMIPSNFHRHYKCDYAAKLRGFGTGAEHLCYLATGQADAAILFGSYLWDIAAGVAMIEAVGCEYAQLNGDPFSPCDYIDGSRITQSILYASPDNWREISQSIHRH
jgi:myo-inositol-1(or 4)-monophosphatase